MDQDVAVDVNHPNLPELCRRFHVKQLDLFGSAADGRFDPAQSDLDFLVTFEPGASVSLFKTYFGLLEGLTELYGRRIDLLTDGTIKNPFLRRSIEAQRRRVYSAE